MLLTIGSKFGKWTVKEKSREKWLCVCNCGTRRRLTRAALIRGETAQCLKCYTQRLPPDTSAFHAVWNDYVQQSKRRRHEWKLTKEEARLMFTRNCFYCGKAPSQIKTIPHGRGSFAFNGIDRIRNAEGYTLDNCVTCCLVCNWMKGTLGAKEFLEHVKRITLHSFNLWELEAEHDDRNFKQPDHDKR